MPTEDDQRLTVEAKREPQFHIDQSAALARVIRLLGITMITKHSDVGSRMREIGMLRALGLRRGSIMTSLLAESVALALVSWGGAGLASRMQFLTNSRDNCQSFSELAFGFALTPAIVVRPLVFALARGWWAPCCPPSARCA